MPGPWSVTRTTSRCGFASSSTPKVDAAAGGVAERIADDFRHRGRDPRLLRGVEAEQLPELRRALPGGDDVLIVVEGQGQEVSHSVRRGSGYCDFASTHLSTSAPRQSCERHLISRGIQRAFARSSRPASRGPEFARLGPGARLSLVPKPLNGESSQPGGFSLARIALRTAAGRRVAQPPHARGRRGVRPAPARHPQPARPRPTRRPGCWPSGRRAGGSAPRRTARRCRSSSGAAGRSVPRWRRFTARVAEAVAPLRTHGRRDPDHRERHASCRSACGRCSRSGAARSLPCLRGGASRRRRRAATSRTTAGDDLHEKHRAADARVSRAAVRAPGNQPRRRRAARRARGQRRQAAAGRGPAAAAARQRAGLRDLHADAAGRNRQLECRRRAAVRLRRRRDHRPQLRLLLPGRRARSRRSRRAPPRGRGARPVRRRVPARAARRRGLRRARHRHAGAARPRARRCRVLAGRPRHHRAQAARRRSPAARRGALGRQPRQGGFPRDALARAAHAAQRDARLDAAAAHGQAGRRRRWPARSRPSSATRTSRNS